MLKEIGLSTRQWTSFIGSDSWMNPSYWPGLKSQKQMDEDWEGLWELTTSEKSIPSAESGSQSLVTVLENLNF